ncbi:MAG: thioredoxin domain-containing protein [Dehalococcoidia bacterium]|nr:thioredoxin domain-containing protein [Dehalococcoidia bacterium]
MPNRLARETSPYLQQHAHNPVDWYPWGAEALERARREDKPILLSIGYSACHWCHVMERESFENPDTAALMNQHYVSIKVDREERPDLDSIYMQTVMSITGHGGWPLTVFLTPDLKPFYGGTYFPPVDHHGMAGFPRVLQTIADAYRTQRAEIASTGAQIAEALGRSLTPQQSAGALTTDTLTEAAQGLASMFESKYGGLGQAPKFPQPMTWEFLLQEARRTGEQLPLLMTEMTLERMAHGGIYDQVGGGFHRYSTDERWLVPHFEKMLYDNALLARLYLHAHQATGKPLYRRVVTETLDYLLREMRGPEGGFYSSQDADSDGVEGKFYVWGYEEFRGLLSEEQRELVVRHYGVTPKGNWEDHTILSVVTELAALAKELLITPEEAERRLGEAKAALLAARSRRIPPATDEKALASWNSLVIGSLAEAGRALGRNDYLDAALRTAEFVLTKLRVDGRLLRTYRNGTAKLKGYLEDYAFLVDGLLLLHAATLEPRWMREAVDLTDEMLALFWDQEQSSFYDVGHDHEELLVRPRDVFDNALPSGSAMATFVLLRVALLTGEQALAEPALASLRSLQHGLAQHPNGFGHWLSVLAFHLGSPKEIAIIGAAQDPGTLRLLEAVHQLYVPHKVVTGRDPTSGDDGFDSPLFTGRGAEDGQPTAYVCEGYVCQLPATSVALLRRQLAPASPLAAPGAG